MACYTGTDQSCVNRKNAALAQIDANNANIALYSEAIKELSKASVYALDSTTNLDCAYKNLCDAVNDANASSQFDNLDKYSKEISKTAEQLAEQKLAMTKARTALQQENVTLQATVNSCGDCSYTYCDNNGR